MQAQTGTDTPAGWQGAREVTVRADVFEDDVQVAVWDRPSAVGQDVVALACEQRLAVKSWLDITQLEATLLRFLPHATYAPLRADLFLLADMVACLFGVDGVGLRVTALRKPLCPRFYVDRIPVGMLLHSGLAVGQLLLSPLWPG